MQGSVYDEESGWEAVWGVALVCGVSGKTKAREAAVECVGAGAACAV